MTFQSENIPKGRMEEAKTVLHSLMFLACFYGMVLVVNLRAFFNTFLFYLRDMIFEFVVNLSAQLNVDI